MTTSTAVTAEQFLLLPDDLCRRDLMEGEVRTMGAAGTQHGIIAMRLGGAIEHYVGERGLGLVFAAETGFTLARNPDTVLAPDAAFLRADRVPAGASPEGFWEVAPDLVVEVDSPGDSRRVVDAKVALYLRYGVRLIWVVRPKSRTVVAYAPWAAPRTLDAEVTLDGGEVLPGFSYPFARLWAGI